MHDNLIPILCKITALKKCNYSSDEKTNNFINISYDSKIIEHNMKTLFYIYIYTQAFMNHFN